MSTKRLRSLRDTLAKSSLDGALISDPSNISYVTETISRDSWLLVTRRSASYITDSRYTEEAKRTLPKGFTVVKISGTLPKTLGAIAKREKLESIGFEQKHLTYQAYTILKDHLEKAANTRFAPFPDAIATMRQVKTPSEIELMRKALEITIKAFRFAGTIIAPGVSELAIAAEIERFIRNEGASAASFDIIVAGGPNASFPHYLTSQRKLKNDEPVLIDMGVTYQGYKSDLTRVFFVGRISTLARKIYNTVLKAQEKAIKLVKPGVLASKVDLAARTTIALAGYGRYFGHSTGHGVGLDVHEAPAISEKSPVLLRPGMIFTIEPGIYLPNKVGVRIEDMVLVTGKGVEVLSGSLDK
jgi:Xaa-Pro aminopeptidase